MKLIIVTAVEEFQKDILIKLCDSAALAVGR